MLFIIPSLEYGGAERSLVELASGLPRDRYEVRVVSLMSGGPLRAALERRGVAVDELGMRPPPLGPGGLRLLPILRRFRPHVIHARLIAASFWGRLFARAHGAKLLGEERALDDDRPPMTSLLNRLSLPLVDLTTANAAQVAARILARDHIQPEKLRIVPAAVDTARFSPRPEGTLPTHDLIAVQRLERPKGLPELLAAFRIVHASRPSTRFLLAGNGSLRGWLEEELARDPAFEKAIEFVGPQEDVPALLHRARIFCLASRDEGTPNALLEAMSAGLAVVTSGVAGSAEVVRDGETGFVVPVGEPEAIAKAALQLLENPALVARMGALGRARVVGDFSIAALVRVYESLYDELDGRR